MSRFRKSASLLAAVLMAGASLPPAIADDGNPARAMVPAPVAVAAFRTICIDEAPDFSGATDAMHRAGLSRVADTGTIYHASGTLSARVNDFTYGDGRRVLRCSVVFEDPDIAAADRALEALISKLGDALESSGSDAVGRYGARHWKAHLGGADGEVIAVSRSAEMPLSILLLEFPRP